MPTNDFVPIAGSAGANVTTQAAYLALVSLLANGFSSGVVDSPSFNKALRQASAIAAGVAQYVADLSGDNVLDDGNAANLLASIKKAVAAQIDAQSGNYALDTGGANASVIAVNPPVTVYPPGMTVRFRKAVSNTGACTLNAGAGALPLNNDLNGALLANDAPAGSVIVASFDAAANTWLINTLVPSQALSQAAADARYMAIAAGLNFNGIGSTAITTTWTKAASVGKFLYISAAGATTQTLPLASTFSSGQSIAFFNNGSGTPTFTRQGTDPLLGVLGGGSSFVLNPGEAVILTTDGVSWFCNFLNGAVGLAPQTRQNLLGSRAMNTPYTNNTPRPIEVTGYLTCTTANNFQTQVNGVTVNYITSPLNGVAPFFIRVLPGESYLVNPGGLNFTLSAWFETR